MHCRRALVIFHSRLNFIESFNVDYSGNAVGDNNVSEFVFADIFSVRQNAEYGIIGKRIIAVGYTARIHYFFDFFRAFTVNVKSKYFSHDGG